MLGEACQQGLCKGVNIKCFEKGGWQARRNLMGPATGYLGSNSYSDRYKSTGGRPRQIVLKSINQLRLLLKTLKSAILAA